MSDLRPRDQIERDLATIQRWSGWSRNDSHAHMGPPSGCADCAYGASQDRLVGDVGALLERLDAETQRADANADACNWNADEIGALRAKADELRRQLLDETYSPEGGEIVMRELGKIRGERDALRSRVDELKEALHDARPFVSQVSGWSSVGPRKRQVAEAGKVNARITALLAGDAARPVPEQPQ